MPVSWPDAVPHKAIVGSFKLIEPWRANDATDFDEGPQRLRPSSSMEIAQIQFTVRMTPVEFLVFKAWAKDDLVKGTLAFTMSVWTGGGYEARTCHLVGGTYGADPGDGLATDVSLTLDVEDY